MRFFNTMKKEKTKALICLISIIALTIELIVFQYFKFDILNIMYVLVCFISLAIMIKNERPFKSWLLFEILAVISFMISFYSYCHGRIAYNIFEVLLIIGTSISLTLDRRKINIFSILVICILIYSVYADNTGTTFFPTYIMGLVFIFASFTVAKETNHL